ncbi:MAG: phasin family protein [Pseudolabrys sp.]
MPRPGPAGFDMPNEMRAFAEKSVEQARAAFDSFISAAQQAVNTAQAQAVSAQTGAREVGELALRYAEENISASFSLAQRLMTAREPAEIAAIHADYVKNQIATLTDQAKELSKRAIKLAGQGGQH